MTIDTATADALHEALSALESVLARRSAALMDEVARYPRPIARCDEQLTGLIEQRAGAVTRLRDVRALAAARNAPESALSARVTELLAGYPAPEDADEAACVARLRALAASSGSAR